MPDSNTPTENKKRSAFSRFFSRKKNKETQKEVNDNSEAEILSQDSLDVVKANVVEADTVETNVVEKSVAEAPQVNTNEQADLTQQANTSTESLLENNILADHSPIDKQTDEQKPSDSIDQVKPVEPTVQSPVEATNQVESLKQVETPAQVQQVETIETAEIPKVSEASQTSQTQADIESAESSPTTEKPEAATVKQGLTKSRTSFFNKITDIFKSSFNLDDELFDELEELLITSDIGIDASLNLVENLRTRVKKEKIQDANGVVIGLRKEITQMLEQSEQEWSFTQKPYVILMVGVNGAGKTTTTAKIAKHFQDQGKSVMLAAADTFRAAAVEQLQEWGKRLSIPVVAQANGSDAAAVAHDALTSAIAKDVDILMIDTAGRLHTQSDLMEQLSKVNRVLAKIDPSTPHEVMQILDAGTGQNALNQLEHFQKAVGVSSICLSKLDGSAKGGIAISLSEKSKLPIRFIGVGEGFGDLKRFSASQFADALVPDLDNK